MYGFATSISPDGQMGVVTAPVYSGSLASYRAGRALTYAFAATNGDVTASMKQALYPTGEAAFAQFGTSVSLSASGNVLAVGACESNAMYHQAGAAFVYTRPNASIPWSLTGELLWAGARQLSLYGWAVAATDTVVFVGAPYLDNNRGAVIGYAGPHNWHAGAPFLSFMPQATNIPTYSRYGWAIVASDDFMVASAPQLVVDGVAAAGMAFAFHYDAVSGLWSETGSLRVPASMTARLQQFGSSMALSGRTLAIGCVGFDTSLGGNRYMTHSTGAVFVFVAHRGAEALASTRSGNRWAWVRVAVLVPNGADSITPMMGWGIALPALPPRARPGGLGTGSVADDDPTVGRLLVGAAPTGARGAVYAVDLAPYAIRSDDSASVSPELAREMAARGCLRAGVSTVATVLKGSEGGKGGSFWLPAAGLTLRATECAVVGVNWWDGTAPSASGAAGDVVYDAASAPVAWPSVSVRERE